jgi:hypothetical protein
MAYAQIKFPQIMGTGPKAVSIAAAGCFVTSFSNLLQRFGITEDPAALNQFFIDHGTYIVEKDGTKDLLAFSSITAFDGSVRITAQGSGSPTEDNSIVKFVYDGGKTHFCLVANAGLGTIIDSWDGVTKSWNAYGGPVAYATYTNAAAQPTTTAKTQARYAVVETYPNGKQVKLNKQPTHLWGMNYAFDYMASHPVETHNEGEVWTVTNKVHHEDGMDYYRREGQVDGFNILDCDDFTPPEPVAAPVPEPKTYTINVVDGITFSAIDGAPKAMYVNRVGGIEKWVFKGVTNWRDFKSVEHLEYGAEVFIVGQAKHPIPPVGATYLMVDADFGNFRNTGDVVNQYGFGIADLSETRPPALPANTPAPAVPDSPEDWHDTYKPFASAVHYVATRDMMVHDLNGQQPDLPLPRYTPGAGNKLGMVAAYGTVTKDGVEYYRLKIATDVNFEHWYCVPKTDPVTRTANLLVAPGEVTTPVSKTTVAKDAVVLAKSHIEINAIKFLDDIIPKFLRNKKTK